MKSIGIAAFAALLLASSAQAAVVYDGSQSTAGTYNDSWVANTNAQNFLMKFTLTQDTSIGGVAVWSGGYFNVGGTATMKLVQDSGGAPLTSGGVIVPLAQITTTVASAIADAGSFKVIANFSTIDLLAGSYWIGLSGGSGIWAQADYIYGNTVNDRVQLGGNTNLGPPAIQNLPFQVLSASEAAAAVPEPATWGMMLIGFGAIGAAMRRSPVRTSVRFG